MLLTNAIALPSGDHDSGDEGDPGGKVMGKLQAPEVSRFAAPPLALISQMCADVT